LSSVVGVHLIPSTGEFTYDTVPYQGAMSGGSLSGVNTFYAPGGTTTDYSYAIDQLQAAHPECTCVSVVCAWFCDDLTAGGNQLYPSTIYANGSFQKWSGSAWVSDNWQVSSLDQGSGGLIPLPTINGGAVYGGTPSDQSIVRCIRDLKSRGFKVVFYPFVLMTATGYPWRGLITFSPDLSSAATSAVDAFLGSASRAQFTPDPVNLTVAYSGSPTDYTYRRMILHYAWLCTVAGGVNLFVIGSELRGLETIRGPSWTKAGTTDGSGYAIWDYPFVAGLQTLSDDVRAIFDGQSLMKNLSTLDNLVAYSADWSSWMGFQHPGENGQWPHLDQLWAHSNIDFVCFDNYLPLSDWTTARDGGLDAVNWLNPAPSGSWPPSSAAMSGLGLTGSPTILSKPYLKANIEGGEKFNWYYSDGNNDGRGLDPNGSGLEVSLPEGDRLSQLRNPYDADQQILANKQLRWWWNNVHQAVYNTGLGWVPQGPQTEWQAQSKSICFLEYGFPACDKGTNQPNVFFDAKSIESATPYWSIWQPTPGGGFAPRRDDTIQLTALAAIYEYWNTDGHNATSGGGVAMVQFAFSCVWNWDARPFPTFPILSSQWGDAADWRTGDWLNGRGPALPPTAAPSPPSPGTYATFPALAGLGWSTHIKPRFATGIAGHVSGRSTRAPAYASANYDLELTYDVLSAAASCLGLQQIAGFFATASGEAMPFWVAPPGLSSVNGQIIGIGDGVTTSFPLLRSFGTYSETVAGTSGVTAVYFNGVSQGSGWSAPTYAYAPAIVFTTAPAADVTISADFGALFLCRFAENLADLENFMALLWTFQTVKLKTMRP
jgi:hypothetical protein